MQGKRVHDGMNACVGAGEKANNSQQEDRQVLGSGQNGPQAQCWTSAHFFPIGRVVDDWREDECQTTARKRPDKRDEQFKLWD